MTSQDEIQIQLDELDTRLDRLRASYEQYFVGIEKLEPHVQKKDVERRVHALRKEQLRNTAARFRFQALVQKYTVYLTYWQRICRRIEEGTYKREAMRAQRYGASSVADATSGPERAVRPSDPPPLAPDGVAGLDEPFSGTSRQKMDALTQPTAPQLRGPVPFSRESIPNLPAITPPAAVAAVPDVTPEAGKPSTAAPANSPKAAAPRRTGISPFGAPQPKPAPRSHTPKPDGPVRRRSSGSMRAVKPAVPLPPAPAPARAPATLPAAVVSPPTQAAPIASKPAPPIPILSSRPPMGPRSEAPRAPSDGDPSVRALIERYRAMRRTNGEGEIAFDTVARQVKETLPKLAERYPGQDVSLDVIVKDGKTVLRPVVRSRR